MDPLDKNLRLAFELRLPATELCLSLDLTTGVSLCCSQNVCACRNVGLLKVHIVEAQDLDKEDFIGKSDPLVEVWTQQTHIETTVSILLMPLSP